MYVCGPKLHWKSSVIYEVKSNIKYSTSTNLSCNKFACWMLQMVWWNYEKITKSDDDITVSDTIILLLRSCCPILGLTTWPFGTQFNHIWLWLYWGQSLQWRSPTCSPMVLEVVQDRPSFCQHLGVWVQPPDLWQNDERIWTHLDYRYCTSQNPNSLSLLHPIVHYLNHMRVHLA